MTDKIKLSHRLQKVASYLPKGAFFADIGSDHAYLPCYVCSEDQTAKAIAGEINVGPFNSAVATVNSYGLFNNVEVRLGNGLHVLHPNEVEQVIIAGMGGSLIQDILEEGKANLGKVNRIIAQPNVDARNVRRWFWAQGYGITNEAIIEENGHIYEIIIGDKDGVIPVYEEEKTEKDLLFGPLLLQNKSDVFHKKWKHEYKKLKRVIEQMNHARVKNIDKIKRFEKELQWIEEVLKDD
ncbi:tRNA (adenine(22)-N(1))-methyltransferase TrmK [Virgibacillus ainsalahensis]